MTETVDTTPGASQTEGFQTLGPTDLSDLESSVSIEAPGKAAVEIASERAPAAGLEAQAGTRAAESLAGTVVRSGVEGVASAEGAAAQRPDAPTEVQSAAPVLKEATECLPNTAKGKSAPTRRAIKAACGVILLSALISGSRVYTRHSDPELGNVETRPVPTAVVAVLEKPASDSSQSQPVADDHFAWEARLREIDMLRQVLLAKKEEIRQLQENYHYGILELEEEAARLIRRGGFDALPQALKNRQFELALQSIQRRQSYHDSLEKLMRWIDLGNEELLYLQRRAFFDLQLKDIAEGMDLAAHKIDIESALMRYQPTAERLSINNSVPLQPSPEAIWRRLAEQARHVESSAEDQRNQGIIAEVCSGNFGRLSELSSLTLKGARCLAESGVSQLFLNRLSGMSPATARKLCEWPGQWLCLNGVTRLSPELASQLFAWPGEWMSLNGLSEVPDEVAKYLVKWKGRQLELMGLRKSTGIVFLAQWEVSGRRLFVPDDIRRQIEMFRRTGQLPTQARNSNRS